ncbi:MAG TPA: hypothetical protein PKE29_04840 [Phycisphaerales bacterium]|nr:hypothetical protein [Phycisphaerales bacterium]
MKPHPKLRKTIKWGGAAVTVLLVVVWFASNWYSFMWSGNQPQSWTLSIGFGDLSWERGAVELEWGSYPIPPENLGPKLRYTRGSVGSGFSWSVGRAGGMVWAPLWAFFVASALATGAVWWFDYRVRLSRAGCCPECLYNRTGLAKGSVCPECGANAPKGG